MKLCQIVLRLWYQGASTFKYFLFIYFFYRERDILLERNSKNKHALPVYHEEKVVGGESLKVSLASEAGVDHTPVYSF